MKLDGIMQPSPTPQYHHKETTAKLSTVIVIIQKGREVIKIFFSANGRLELGLDGPIIHAA